LSLLHIISQTASFDDWFLSIESRKSNLCQPEKRRFYDRIPKLSRKCEFWV